MNNFMVESQRPFQSSPLRREFGTREEMSEYIATLKSTHFVGVLEPYVLVEGQWEVDEQGLKLLDTATVPEQQMIFAGAARMLQALSKVKRVLTEAELFSLDKELRLVYQVCNLEVEPQIDVNEVFRFAAPNGNTLAALTGREVEDDNQ